MSFFTAPCLFIICLFFYAIELVTLFKALEAVGNFGSAQLLLCTDYLIVVQGV